MAPSVTPGFCQCLIRFTLSAHPCNELPWISACVCSVRGLCWPWHTCLLLSNAQVQHEGSGSQNWVILGYPEASSPSDGRAPVLADWLSFPCFSPPWRAPRAQAYLCAETKPPASTSPKSTCLLAPVTFAWQ